MGSSPDKGCMHARCLRSRYGVDMPRDGADISLSLSAKITSLMIGLDKGAGDGDDGDENGDYIYTGYCR